MSETTLGNLERRGPGRPSNAELAARSEPPRVRAERKPFGTMEQKLAYPDRQGFHRHWFNDVPGRVTRALEAGYEHVKDNEGKNVREIVGTAEGGGPLHAFLMEIPEEWYKEDMAAQQREINERENAITRGKVEGASPTEQNKFYVGGEGTSIRHGR